MNVYRSFSMDLQLLQVHPQNHDHIYSVRKLGITVNGTGI